MLLRQDEVLTVMMILLSEVNPLDTKFGEAATPVGNVQLPYWWRWFQAGARLTLSDHSQGLDSVPNMENQP